jgi:hypothetical protein
MKIAIAQDSLMYLESMSPQSMAEFENDGKVTFRVSFSGEIGYRAKAQFTYRGFELYYLNQGGEKEIEQCMSLSWSSKWMKLGMGRGQPNIAKGMILGNTMMRFTPDPRSQSGISPAKLKIKNYDYYKELVFASAVINKFDISLFRYNDTYGGFIQYRQKKWFTGAAWYGLGKPVIETWANYKSDQIKGSVNASLASGNLNHATGDLYYSQGVFRLFISAIYLHPEFLSLKSDSKWGSGLKAGSQGYASGAGLLISPWKINILGYCILRDNYQEQRYMLDLRYKKKPLEVILSYSSKVISELKENDNFPFARSWQEQEYRICKMNVKFQIKKELQLSYQLQGDIMNLQSYASVLRLTYRKSGNLLRFQLSNCRSWDNALYFLRPLTSSAYSIRRAPKEETVYLDLIYSRDIGMMKIYVLLRNEGMNVGFDIKL